MLKLSQSIGNKRSGWYSWIGLVIVLALVFLAASHTVLRASAHPASDDTIRLSPAAPYYLEVRGLTKGSGLMSSAYRVANLGTSSATTIHTFINDQGVTIAERVFALPGADSQVFQLSTIGEVPAGFAGWVGISSDQPLSAALIGTSYVDTFENYTPGSPPAGWFLRGASPVTPIVEEVGGTGPAFRLVSFPAVSWQYWDRWLLKEGLSLSSEYTVTVQLNAQNVVADRGGLTIAWNDQTWDRIDIQPNVYHNTIEFRVTYTGPIVSSPAVNNVGTISIIPGVNYWLRVAARQQGPGQGTVTVYWSTDGRSFTPVVVATGLADLSGGVGLSTAGPNLPHVHFDDFSVLLPPQVLVSPSLTSLSPASVVAGGQAFTLTASGSNFVPGSTVRWNGADRPTTYVSGNSLQAAISSLDIASAGTASVTVLNPEPGGGLSGSLSFAITTAAISGRITDGAGQGIAGVQVSGAGQPATSDATGNFSLAGLSAGPYTLTPSKPGYTFSPASRNVTVPPNATGQDFVASPAQAAKRWTFMLYMDGDTGQLDYGEVHRLLGQKLQRLEQNPNEQVQIVALIDGPGTLDTFRVTFNPAANYQPLGEKAMDNPATLIEFVQNARRDFPADYYYLAIADHANGVQGIAWDTTSGSSATAYLTPAELRQAFVTITNNGAQPLDVVHFDGCSFGLLENAALGKDVVRYVVATENIGWGIFAYPDYRALVGASTTPAQLAQGIAQRYAELVTQQQYPYTISALDLSRLDGVLSALNALSDGLTQFSNGNQSNRTLLMNLRQQSQKFDSGVTPLEITNDDWYVDLADFAARVKPVVTSDGVPAAAQSLLDALRGSQPFVLYSSRSSGTFEYGGTRTWNLDGAFGVSIYYPEKAAGATFGNYANGATYPSFHSLTRWHTFLAAGLPALAPGDPPPADGPLPLGVLSIYRYKAYLPLVIR